jgi:hypothetical protein
MKDALTLSGYGREIIMIGLETLCRIYAPFLNPLFQKKIKIKQSSIIQKWELLGRLWPNFCLLFQISELIVLRLPAKISS